jgi:hypothetical protein
VDQEHEPVPHATLTARVRLVWESLAGVPVSFAPVVRVAVSPRSRLCPPGWAGLVIIGDRAIATAPGPPVAQVMQQALSTVPAASVTDAAVLNSRLDVAEMLGPASLAYLDATDFRPRQDVAAELAGVQDPALRRFLASAEPEDVGESGMAEITSPAFTIGEQGQIVAIAGYRDWPGGVAHVSVLTATHARGRGLGAAAASGAVLHALSGNKLPQWRARAAASCRIAAGLGFTELGSQVSIRLGSAEPPPRRP